VIKGIKLFAIVALMFMIFGCTSNDPMPPDQAQNMNDVEIPDGFDWDFTRNVNVVIIASDSEGNLVEGTEVSLYKTQNNMAFTMSTNSSGELRTDITLPESSSSVILEYDGQQVTIPVIGNTVYHEMTVEPVRDIRGNGTIFVPGSLSVLTLMYEDNWPVKGDYDFNDMVVESWGKLRYVSDYLRYIELSAKVVASGATYHNGFSIIFDTSAFPNTSLGDAITFSAYDSDDNLLPLNSSEVNAAYGTDVIWWTAEGHLQFKFFNDIFDVMAPPQGSLAMNTNIDAPWVDPITIKIRIDYSISHLIGFDPSNPSFNLNALNPYIEVNGVTGYEIHLPGDFLTGNFSQEALFGTGDDNTPLAGEADPMYSTNAFTTVDGLSWGLKLEGILEYPREQVDVILAYPELADYFAGTQGIFDNWWQPHPDPNYTAGYIYDRGDMTVADQDAPVGE